VRKLSYGGFVGTTFFTSFSILHIALLKGVNQLLFKIVILICLIFKYD